MRRSPSSLSMRRRDFVPSLPKAEVLPFMRNGYYGEIFHLSDVKNKLAHRPILALEHLFADLLLYAEQELSEFQILALDRCRHSHCPRNDAYNLYRGENPLQTGSMGDRLVKRQALQLQEIRDYVMTVKACHEAGPMSSFAYSKRCRKRIFQGARRCSFFRNK